jgi:hypothetical protein
MDESANEVLLDEMSTPDGDIELVAYQSREPFGSASDPRDGATSTDPPPGLQLGSTQDRRNTTWRRRRRFIVPGA